MDRFPVLNPDGLRKFMKHGFDPELGWIRKPNTSHDEIGRAGRTTWHINQSGARNNPGYENHLPLISCYGDSFTFSRQVNDDETWEHRLSQLTNSNVLNWGVGNHGIDQTFLRLIREYPNYPTPIVIIGVVPDTISRILSGWKHFYEYGNTFAFKPQFALKENKAELLHNLINAEDKFLNYRNYYSQISQRDYFYHRKFKDEIFSFPYLFSFLRNFQRNFSIIRNISLFQKNQNPCYYNKAFMTIMNVNLRWRIKLFKNHYATKLLKSIIEVLVNYSNETKFKLVIIFLPQKDDVLFVRKKGHFYNEFVMNISDRCCVFDMMSSLLEIDNIDEFYSDNNDYGGHYSDIGNKYVSDKIYEYIINHKLI